MRRARQVATSAVSAASVSLVVPRGTGTPSARKRHRLADVRIGDQQRAAGGEERGLLGAAA